MLSFPFLMIKPPILNELADVLLGPLSLPRGDGREQSSGCECCSHEVSGGVGCKKINHSMGI
jgi:hypothetical protein